MLTRPAKSVPHASRAETAVFALLGVAALLCLTLAGATALNPPPTPVAAWQPPDPGAPQLAVRSPHWRADLRTAYHAMAYLLDPRV